MYFWHPHARDGLVDEEWIEERITGWEEFAASAAEMSPQRAKEITGISVERIEWLARMYATNRPAAIRVLVGPEHRAKGREIMRAVAMLPAVTGAWRDVGGGLARSTQVYFETALNYPPGPTVVRRTFNMARLGEVLTDDTLTPRIEALVVHNSNPAVIVPDQNRIIAGLERDDLFTVVIEQFMTDTARYADIVLPSTTQIEHLDLGIAWGHLYLALNEPAIAPVGEALPNTEIFRRLAAAMGLDDPTFSDDDETLIRQLLDSDHPWLDGITYEHLTDHTWARLQIPAGTRPYVDTTPDTDDGRLHLTTLRFEPGDETRSGNSKLQERFPLALMTRKTTPEVPQRQLRRLQRAPPCRRRTAPADPPRRRHRTQPRQRRARRGIQRPRPADAHGRGHRRGPRRNGRSPVRLVAQPHAGGQSDQRAHQPSHPRRRSRLRSVPRHPRRSRSHHTEDRRRRHTIMTGRFTARPTRYVRISTLNGWRLKRYEITLDATPVSDDVNTAIDELLTEALPAHDGVGFIVVHQGAEQMWLLADLWQGDIIHQHTFFANLDTPTEFQPVAAGGPTACVCELAVHSHERDAYVRHVLDPADGPDINAYLSDVITVPVRSRRQLIEDFNDAWTRGDLDGLMALMADDPAYRASTGHGPGTDHHGTSAVRDGFAAVITAEAANDQPAPPPGVIHIAAERGFSMWAYPTTGPDCTPRTVEGIDVWTFEGDRIATKDAYRKSFPESRSDIMSQVSLATSSARFCCVDRSGSTFVRSSASLRLDHVGEFIESCRHT